MKDDLEDPWRLSPLLLPSPAARLNAPGPRPSFSRLSSFDNLLTYREEVAECKRASSLLRSEVNEEINLSPEVEAKKRQPWPKLVQAQDENTLAKKQDILLPVDDIVQQRRPNGFRSLAGEIGFCFTIAMTQFLTEYLISGFAIALPELTARSNIISLGPGSLGLFWPASLLSLSLSASLLIFARLADIYGGYGILMGGLLWLSVWTLVPGFFTSVIILDVARAMQGLALAAFTPSTFVLVSTFYNAGRRKNFVLGLYSGCAPLGFFAGILTAGVLPPDRSQWYLWIASILTGVTAITAYLTIPHDWTNRKQLDLKMDWLGSFLITAGLVLLSYAVAFEPDANLHDRTRNGFSYPDVYGPFAAGLACLAAAACAERWYAECPLIPFDFFRPKSTMALCLAGLCFYASYGVWLYESAEYFQSGTGTTMLPGGLDGIKLALWYTPTAVGGLALCVVGAALLHIISMKMLLLVSALAWIGAPLLLALCPLPLNYWEFVLPSMLCATIGIDLTYTISLVYFSSAQPKRYQGLCGAVCSILVNLAISFSLPISEIIEARADGSVTCTLGIDRDAFQQCEDSAINWSYRATFIYAAASACCGLVICVLFVRLPGRAAIEKAPDEERPASLEISTLVNGAREH
jgi:MFS family permease